jgi:hypothetical protein
LDDEEYVDEDDLDLSNDIDPDWKAGKVSNDADASTETAKKPKSKKSKSAAARSQSTTPAKARIVPPPEDVNPEVAFIYGPETWGRCYDHNFLRFFPIFGKKLTFFSKTNVMIKFFA